MAFLPDHYGYRGDAADALSYATRRLMKKKAPKQDMDKLGDLQYFPPQPTDSDTLEVVVKQDSRKTPRKTIGWGKTPKDGVFLIGDIHVKHETGPGRNLQQYRFTGTDWLYIGGIDRDKLGRYHEPGAEYQWS